MKNMIKMSLVAAVAVAGLSSNVAAQPLTEAIKDVDISGSIVYRYNDYGQDENSVKSENSNDYKIAASLKSKVNDYVTATVRVVTGTGALNDSNAGRTSLDNTTASDANPDLQVNQANFTVKTDVATVIAGKQGLTTPWTTAIDSDGTEQTGTGVLALIPAGPVTVAAAYFNQTNLSNATSKMGVDLTTTAGYGAGYDEDTVQDVVDDAMNTANVATVGVLANVGPVSLNAWYLDLKSVFETYTIGAKTTIEGITAELKYTELELEDTLTSDAIGHGGDKDNSAIIAKVSTKVGPVGLGLNYGKTDKDGGLTALNSTASTTLLGWTTTMHNKADADMWMLNANMDVLPTLNVALNYNTVDYANDSEETEIFTQITHKMSKNFSTYVRLGQYDAEVDNEDTSDSFRGRLQVEYKF